LVSISPSSLVHLPYAEIVGNIDILCLPSSGVSCPNLVRAQRSLPVQLLMHHLPLGSSMHPHGLDRCLVLSFLTCLLLGLDLHTTFLAASKSDYIDLSCSFPLDSCLGPVLLLLSLALILSLGVISVVVIRLVQIVLVSLVVFILQKLLLELV
jgi:hypothetical protein